jgi:hypothetical protein
LVGAVPTLGVLPVHTFPDRAVHGDVTGMVCASWHDGHTELLVGQAPLLSGLTPVRLAQADDDGPRVDAVHLPPGRSAFVADGPTRWLVTDLGTRFTIADTDTERVLGLAEAMPVPRAVLDALPQGPVLSRSAALMSWDGIQVR